MHLYAKNPLENESFEVLRECVSVHVFIKDLLENASSEVLRKCVSVHVLVLFTLDLYADGGNVSPSIHNGLLLQRIYMQSSGFS